MELENKEMLQNLLKERQTEEILFSCIKQLNSNADFETVMTHVLTSILHFYEGARAYVFEFDWIQGLTTNTHEVCAQGVSPEISNLQSIPISFVETWVRAFKHGEEVFQIEDVDALEGDPHRQGEYMTLSSQNIKSLIAVPIRYEGKLHGFLGVDDPTCKKDESAFLVKLTYFICNEMDKRRLGEELRRLSFSDYLTQFSNRNAYNVYLEEIKDKALKNIGVLFADLNSLKYMNDTFGHEYGDRLLQHMADVLRKHFQNRQIFRISGDEFVVICENIDQMEFQGIVAGLQESLIGQNEELASIGCLWDGECTDIRKMIYEAEQRMYRNKQQYHHAKPGDADKHSELLQLFLKNIYKDRFLFYLQPQFDAVSGEMIGAEALARRISSTGEVILPYDFIPIMEKENMIPKLDFQIMEQVCEKLRHWQEVGMEMVPIAINFSNTTLAMREFPDRFMEISRHYGIDPSLLIIEITRNGIRMGREALRNLIETLSVHRIQVRVKNLTMENDFPAMMTLDGIRSVKLDISLVHEMEEHFRTQMLVQTLIDLCHRMGQKCMASGVESEAQAALLKTMGCDSMQGYYFERPIAVEVFEKKYLHKTEKSAETEDAVAAVQIKEEGLPKDISALDSAVFDLLAQSSDQLYIYIADLKTDFSRWSHAAVKYFGLPSEYISGTAKVWSSFIHPDDRHIFLDDMGRIFKGASNQHQCEYRARNARGEYVWVQCNGVAKRNPDGSPGLFAGTMINLRSVSKFDAVTGLLSPYEFQSQFQQLMDEHKKGVLLLFGIDHFKRINDVHGYQMGDQILRGIALRVQMIPDCIFYRMDGDKMACVILEGKREDAKTIFEDVDQILKTIQKDQESDIHISASCGAVLFPEHGEQMEILRANAEYALEQAKISCRGSIEIYSESLHKKSVLFFRMQEVLRKAIANDFEGFELYYQPQINTQTGEIFGAEALLRFSSPMLPPVTPADFIPVLEETGAISEVGAWILRTALYQAEKWRQIYPDFHISVNASYIQMRRADFRNMVLRELHYSKVPPNALILELTESCKVTDPERLREDFEFFIDHQIQVALDDFGTGYASIAILRELTPTWIKIDHTFVASISKSPMDQAIIEYIMQLCRYAGIHVCIEGVENEEIHKIVCKYQPDSMQGYYFSRPLAAEVFEETYMK